MELMNLDLQEVSGKEEVFVRILSNDVCRLLSIDSDRIQVVGRAWPALMLVGKRWHFCILSCLCLFSLILEPEEPEIFQSLRRNLEQRNPLDAATE